MGNPVSKLVAKLAFLPPPPSYEPDWRELVWLQTERGQKIAACFLPCPGAKFTVLFSHANAEGEAAVPG